jgi:hypothetical protein
MPVFRLEVVITVVVERKKLVATQKWSDNRRHEVTKRRSAYPGPRTFPLEGSHRGRGRERVGKKCGWD